MTDNKNCSLLSKIATGEGHSESSPYFDGWKAYESDPYQPMGNPGGVIQMGLAENQLLFNIVEEWIKRNPAASICSPQSLPKFRDTAIFQDYHGLPEFRTAVARFMEKVRGGRVKFEADRIVMSGGATGAQEMIAFCLADPGEAFLIPSPYYPAFDRDLCWRTGVKLIPVVTTSHNNFKITRSALEAAYTSAQRANIRVKGVVLANPSNPLGTMLDREALKSLVSFVNEKSIHLVCDEIYGATTFGQRDFISIAEVIEEEEITCNKDLVHIVYSLSKDLGFPGFRVGIIYSYNDMVVGCARKMSSFGLVSTQTQHLIASMLSDEEFVERFLAESARRLARRYRLFTSGLAEVGIRCLESNAGLFCWMDLRPLLTESSWEGEMTLWRTVVHKVKLNVSPGSSFHCTEPGWFRACFANMDDETMNVALQRIRAFIALQTNKINSPPRRRWENKLRLSFSANRSRFDEMGVSPHAMSPHSPLLHAAS